MSNDKSLLPVEPKLPKNLSIDERAVHARIRTRATSLRYRERGGLARLFHRSAINILPDEKSV